MAHHNTVFAQLLKFVSRHEFEKLAKRHHFGQKLRSINRWSQFVCLCLGQLSGRLSLRDIESNMKAQASRLFHLGARPVARTSLSRLNQKQPYTLYEALFGKLYARCQGLAPKHGFRFKNKLYSLDASLIDLSLKIFPWAHYALGKAAMKLHVALDHRGHLPSFAAVTVGKTSDVEIGRTINFTKGSIVVIDKGYVDYEWFKNLTNQGVFFVTRLRNNALWRITKRQKVNRATGVTSDQHIVLTGVKATKMGMPTLRRIGYRDATTGQRYEFLTNNFRLSAKTIADIYKQRWQIELFFKWIKQNLKIKTFIGNTKNAVLTQIWAALCVCLLLAYIKFVSKIGGSLQSMLRLLQLNLFMRRDLLSLLNNRPPDVPVNHKQLCLL
jgi:putative transposase